MYAFAHDPRSATLVGLKAGAPCTDADYERIVASTRRLMREAPASTLPVFLLVVASGQPSPSPVWRKRLADARDVGRPFRYVIASASPEERGAVIAIQWIRPPASDQRIVWRATFDEAVAWTEAEGGPRPILRSLYAYARRDFLKQSAAEARSATDAATG